MFYGQLVGEVCVLTDKDNGRPVYDSEVPEVAEGYALVERYIDCGSHILHLYTQAPIEGTPEQAALALSRMQAMSLPDEALYEVRALAPEYEDGMTCYGEGNEEGMSVTRCRYEGRLFRFIGQGTQVMQPGWTPVGAPSLWAEILPGQEGSGVEVGKWVQPGPDNAYQPGDKVIHNGHLWESTYTDDQGSKNVWEPGVVGVGEDIWKDLGPVEGGDA